MRCPDETRLLAQLEGHEDQELSQHLTGCEACRGRSQRLAAGLGLASEAAAKLGAETPPGLEQRLRASLDTGATTLRADAERPGWFQPRRVAAGVAALAAGLVVAVLLTRGAAPEVNAAQLIERTESAFLQLPAEGSRRFVYTLRYQGPDYGMLPEGSGEYRLEELWRLGEDPAVRVALTAPDGALVRGFLEQGDTRRMLFHSPVGAFDLRFALEDGGRAQLEQRRRELAESMFGALVRMAEPERLVQSQDARSHVLELRPPRPGEAGFGVGQLERARVVIERDSFRLLEASVSGRVLGEPFAVDVRVERQELLPPLAVTDADFVLPELEGAVVLEGPGTAQPLADIARLLLTEVQAGRLGLGQPEARR